MNRDLVVKWLLSLFCLIFLSMQVHSQELNVLYQGERAGFVKTQKKESIELTSAKGEFNSFTIEADRVAFNKVLSKIQIKNSNKNYFDIKSYLLLGHHFKKSSSNKLKKKFINDIVVPIENFSLFKGELENRRGKNNFYYFEIFVRHNTPKGKYPLEFTIDGKKLKVIINVYDFTIPRKSQFISTFGFAPWTVTLKHYGKWVEDNNNLFDNYFSLANEHRIDLHKVYTNYGKDKNLMNFKMDRYRDTYFELSKNMFNGIRSEYGFKHNSLDLPFETNRSNDKKYLKQFDRELSENNYKDNYFLYYIDEPNKEQKANLESELKFVKNHFPSANILVTTDENKSYFGLIDWWVLNVIQLNKNGKDKIKRIKSKSKKTFFYTSCNSHGCDKSVENSLPDFVIDRPGGHIRGIPWLGLLNNLDGFLYYDTVRGYQEEGLSPWNDQFLFTGYGEGNLFYPCLLDICRKEGRDKAFVSLRLKIYRDGVEDYEILKSALNRGYPLNKIMNKFKDFSLNEVNIKYYENMKKELLDFLIKNEKK